MLTHLGNAQKQQSYSVEAPERIVVVSNRAPVQYSFTETGRLKSADAGGGVATALALVARTTPVTWLASASSDADRMLAIAGGGLPLSASSVLRFLNLPEDAYHLHYETFCNPVLWFLQHGLQARLERDLSCADIWRAWQQGYRHVNQLYADAIVEEMDRGGSDKVMLHDYHFYLTPRMVRACRPDATLQHFVHIPWPAPHAWSALPRDIVSSICRGLLGNDSLVFQTDASVGNFLATCSIYLKDEAVVSSAKGEVRHAGRTTSVWSNPISVDLQALSDAVASAEASGYRRGLSDEVGEKTIVRVDRLDPSKNVAAGFEAFGLLLQDHPEWRGRVNFLAFLVPSRTSIPEYRAYERETLAAARSINERFGAGGWQPVRVYHEHNRLQALVALTMYDVLLVNSLADGMNLVSKEGPVLNQRDGVLVLSENAGSYEELRCAALGVKPDDVPMTAAALDQALRMTPAERRARSGALKDCISRHQIGDWLRIQMKDLTISEYVKSIASGSGRRSGSPTWT